MLRRLGRLDRISWSLLFCAVALAGAAATAYSVRRLVATEQISDEASLTLSTTTALMLIVAAGMGLRSFIQLRTWRERLLFAAVPIGFTLLFCGFVNASMEDASVEMEALVEAQSSEPSSLTIVVGPGGQDVRLAGEIQEGAATRLSALLDAHPEVTRIHLTSEGGLADEGQALGDVIAAHKLTTYVPDYCVSACTLAFIRGRERLILPDSRIGFHAPYQQGLFGAMYRGDGINERKDYRAAGLADGFVDAALKVDPASIWFPRPSELTDAHVITGIVDRYRFPDSELDGSASQAGARELVLRNFALLAALDEEAPQAIDKIAAWYLGRYQRAESEGANTDGLKLAVRSTVALVLSRADDHSLAALAHVLYRALAHAKTPEACALVANGDLTLAVRLAEDELDAGKAVLKDALSTGRQPSSSSRFIAVVSDVDSDPSRHGCDEQRAVLRRLLRDDDQEIARVMRSAITNNARRSAVSFAALLHR